MRRYREGELLTMPSGRVARFVRYVNNAEGAFEFMECEYLEHDYAGDGVVKIATLAFERAVARRAMEGKPVMQRWTAAIPRLG